MFKILLFLLVFYPVISNAKEIVSDGISKTYHSNGKVEKEIPYKNGKKDGIEKLYSYDGVLLLETPYKDDFVHGIVKAYDEKGNVYWEINYQNGKKNGLEKKKKGNLIYETNFKDDVLNGKSKIYTSNAQILFEGTYEDGQLNGFSKSVDGFNQLTEVSYLNGMKHGIEKTYSKDGYLKREKIYERGQIKLRKEFDEYGNIEEERTEDGFYVRYTPEGIVKSYGYYGKKNTKKEKPKDIQKIERIYNDKKQLEKEIYYYTNGKISAILPYKNNMVHGEVIRYYPTGNIKEKTNYKSFNPHGTEVIYYEDGKIQYERIYENGVKVKETQYDSNGNILKS